MLASIASSLVIITGPGDGGGSDVGGVQRYHLDSTALIYASTGTPIDGNSPNYDRLIGHCVRRLARVDEEPERGDVSWSLPDSGAKAATAGDGKMADDDDTESHRPEVPPPSAVITDTDATERSLFEEEILT